MQRLTLAVGYAAFVLWTALLRVNAETFRVATYNLDGYLEQPSSRRPAKPQVSRAKIREVIRSASPDVLALQELGSREALAELAQALKSEGLCYPYSEYICASDTNVHLSILSRFPLTPQRPHTNDTFLLGGRRWHVGRGFGEVEVKLNEHYKFTVLTAHLKSRRGVAHADEAEIRLAEAKLLREKVDARLAAEPGVNLVVLGDLNDTKDSVAVRTVIGRGTKKLTDTQPAEEDNFGQQSSRLNSESRPITWSYFHAASDTYTRIDYILLSAGMTKEWIPGETCIPRVPDWGLASDHRLLVATFTTEDR